MPNLEIRNVIEEDFIKISHLGEKCSPMINERNSIYHIFTKFFKNTSLVVEDNGVIKGFILGFISQDEPKKSYVHLLCVEHSLRGQNIASNLIDEFIKIVSAYSCSEVFLICKPSNKRALKFYNKIGFVSLKSNRTVKVENFNLFIDYDGPKDDKIVFYKSIN
jgi:ribosomal protein S18 acetylase RimI-like enzyme